MTQIDRERLQKLVDWYEDPNPNKACLSGDMAMLGYELAQSYLDGSLFATESALAEQISEMLFGRLGRDEAKEYGKIMAWKLLNQIPIERREK
jgi:hypothetical protein